MEKSFLNMPGLPLGLRNNNPGNIRPGDNWKGMIGTNKNFVVFSSITWGIRAMATDIGNDIKKGLNTITKLINEYAPPSENDTSAYINQVAQKTGYGVNQILPANMDTLQKLIRAQMEIELGKSYADLVTGDDIIQGLRLMNSGLLSFFQFAADTVARNKTASLTALLAAVALGVMWWKSRS